MVVKFDTPTKGAGGKLNNTGSSAAFVNYLGKEDEVSQEQWFSVDRQEVHPAEVRRSIDADHQGIGKAEGKFATGSINPSAEEWKALGSTDEERLSNLKKWVREDFSKEFAENFNKLDKAGNRINIRQENVKIFYKVEHDRHYTGIDKEVKEGLKRQGEVKEGFNVHCHFVVARKTADGQNRISPTTNNRKEFSRDDLTAKVERSFDIRTGYERPIKESYEYAKTMKNGTGKEKTAMLEKSVKQGLSRDNTLMKSLTENLQPTVKVVKQVNRQLGRGM